MLTMSLHKSIHIQTPSIYIDQIGKHYLQTLCIHIDFKSAMPSIQSHTSALKFHKYKKPIWEDYLQSLCIHMDFGRTMPSIWN